MVPMPTDVPSSDHHTVKPWFNGKLAFAPVVPDLGSQGYPLVGARVDVVGLEPAATLVYSRGKHLIQPHRDTRRERGRCAGAKL
jgi:anti-sigma factor RsiW